MPYLCARICGKSSCKRFWLARVAELVDALASGASVHFRTCWFDSSPGHIRIRKRRFRRKRLFFYAQVESIWDSIWDACAFSIILVLGASVLKFELDGQVELHPYGASPLFTGHPFGHHFDHA